MTRKILVVDDTKNIRAMLSTYFELEGYAVDAAANGEEALQFIKDSLYDLIFLDIKMPGISGTEVLRKIRALNQGTPVIIMTAYATVRNAVECTKLGAVDYLRKPFTIQKIKEEVLKILNRKDNPDDNIDSYAVQVEQAKLCIQRSEYQEAKKHLRTAVSLDVDQGESYYLLGAIAEIEQDYEKAAKYYRIALQIDPGQLQAEENLKNMQNQKIKEK